MTWRWRIFFSGWWLAQALAASVSGTVHLVNSVDPGVRKHKDYSGVVVWLKPLSATVLDGEPQRSRTVQMAQKDKRFVPHVLAIPIGAAVEFPNFDPIFHNAFSSYDGQIFDVGLYPPGGSRTVVFKRSGIVRVFCNIHPTMSAVIAVLDSPWFAVSQPSGAFLIRDVPPGEYALRIFHERATESTLRSLDRRISVAPDGLVLPPLTISETGYVETPHKNKYGKDYPPASDEHGIYPGEER